MLTKFWNLQERGRREISLYHVDYLANYYGHLSQAAQEEAEIEYPHIEAAQAAPAPSFQGGRRKPKATRIPASQDHQDPSLDPQSSLRRFQRLSQKSRRR